MAGFSTRFNGRAGRIDANPALCVACEWTPFPRRRGPTGTPAGAPRWDPAPLSFASHSYIILLSQGISNVGSMIRRILLLLVVLAVPAGLATASQALANTANPPLPHQHPIVVELASPPTSSAPAQSRGHEHGDD